MILRVCMEITHLKVIFFYENGTCKFNSSKTKLKNLSASERLLLSF